MAAEILILITTELRDNNSKLKTTNNTNKMNGYNAHYLMFLHHHSICKKFLRAVLFSIFLLNSPLSHLKEEKKMLRTNQTYISLEKK